MGRKGIVSFEFTVTGVEAHSAGCATNGANAVLETAYKIIELVNKMDTIRRENGFEEVTYVSNAGGSDAANVSHSGIPTVDSMGNLGAYIHTPKEYGILSSLPEYAKRLAIVTLNI